MMRPSLRTAQRGASLITALLLLTLITLTVATVFLQSSGNLKSVGNMQRRAEATAAAEAAIEQLISSDVAFRAPAKTTVPADVNGVSVAIAPPVCAKAVPVDAQTSADSNPQVLQVGGAATGSTGYLRTFWDITATATNDSTGARVEVHQGVTLVLPADPNPCL